MQEKINQKEWLGVAGLIFFFLVLRAGFLAAGGIAATDEAYYIQAGLNLLAGKLYPAFGETTAGQPLFPIFLTLGLKWGGDPVLAARGASLILSALTLIPFHLCVRSLATKEETFWSDLIFVLAPFAVRFSTQAMTHSLFNLTLVLMLIFILRAKNSGRFGWAVLAGLAGSAAYLTRVEGLALVVFVAFGTLWVERLGWKFFWGLLASFIFFCVPFWIWLRAAHGVWQLEWIEGSGVTAAFLNQWRDFLKETGPLTHFSPFLAAGYLYLERLAKTYYLLFPRVFPVFVWIILGFGMVKMFSSKKSGLASAVLILLFASFPIFFYPLLGIDARYLSPTGVFLTMFAGPGLCDLWERGGNRKWIRRLGLAVLILNFLPGYGQVLAANRDAPLEHKRMGEWIREHMTTPQVILGSDKLPCFYAGEMCGRFVWLGPTLKALEPERSFEDLLKREGVQLVFVDTRYATHWPKIEFLFTDSPSKRFARLAEFREGQEKIILYRFNP